MDLKNQLDFKLFEILLSAGHDMYALITKTPGTFSSMSESVLKWQLNVTTQP